MLSNRNLKKSRLSNVKLIFTCTWHIIFFFLKFVFWLHGYQYRPELWVLEFSVHDHGLKHGTLAHDEFDHAMNQDQQVSVKRSKTNSQPFHGQEPPISSFIFNWLRFKSLNFCPKIKFFFLLKKKNGWFKIFQLN